MIRGIFVGLSTIDIVYNVDEFPAPNTKIAARSQNVFAGGPATNAAITFAHLGGQATLVTAVGRHPLSQVIRHELDRYGIEFIDLNPDFDGVPALSSVAVDRHGNRNVVSANAARIAAPPAAVDLNLCEQASIVLVDGHSMQACNAWAAAAKDRAVPVVLDGGSWKQGTDALLANVHTAICSADFLPPGCTKEEEVLDYLGRRGVANIAITHGSAPVDFLCGGASGSIAVPRVPVVDTMGAGDIFHGACCYFAAMDYKFADALSAAAQVASESCRYPGTRAWMKIS
jgi:sugar/nucleoside kinase (ribokinase family)